MLQCHAKVGTLTQMKANSADSGALAAAVSRRSRRLAAPEYQGSHLLGRGTIGVQMPAGNAVLAMPAVALPRQALDVLCDTQYYPGQLTNFEDDMKDIDMQRVTFSRSGNYLFVASPYWKVRHNLRAGGCWDSITFTHGSGKNLLGGPVGGRIRCLEPHPTSDNASPYFYAEANDRDPAVRVEEGADGPVVIVEGQYQLAKAPLSGADVPQKLPIRFRRRYEYRAWGIIACELEVICDEPRGDVVEFVAADIALREGMTDALVRDNPAVGTMHDGTGHGKWLKLAGKPVYQNGLVPSHVVAFEKGVEGLEFMPASDLSKWDTNFNADPGMGYYGVLPDWVNPKLTLISLAPYCLAYRRNTIRLAGSYKLRYYIGLPSIKDRATVGSPYFHTSADSRWVSDAELEAMANAGIKLIRFHNDYREGGPFWHDGVYPPYDPDDMAQLKRIIDTCHRLGMKIVPYISVKEFHPEAPDFAANYAAWRKEIAPSFKDLHTWFGSGEFGQLMCLESGWLEFRKKSIDIILKDLPWDGLYFDWCTPHPCRHPGHAGGATHIDQDAFLDFMCWCRQRVGPDGIIMTHLSGYPQIVIENMSDIALIYEDQGGVHPVNPACFPIQCTFMPITPRHLCGWGTDNEQSRCAMVCLLQGHPPLPLPAAMYDGKGGTENLYGKFSQFAGMDFTQYKFSPATDGWVKTGQDNVFGAVWHREGEAVVYLANMGSRGARGSATLDAGKILGPAIARSAKKLIVHRDGAKRATEISARNLKTKGIPYNLKPLESGLFKITLP
jgi:hypothetical protein